MTEGVFPKVDGDVFYASEANLNYYSVYQLYSGGAANISATGTTTSRAGSIVLNYIPPGSLLSRRFVEIAPYFYAKSDMGGGNSTANTTLDILYRPSGVGAFSSETSVSTSSVGGTPAMQDSSTGTLSWLHPITAADLSSGCQFMVSCSGTTANNSSSSIITSFGQISVKLT